MTRFEELKTKHEKKLLTANDALELLELYRNENDYLRNLIAVTRTPIKLNIPNPIAVVLAGSAGFLTAKMLE